MNYWKMSSCCQETLGKIKSKLTLRLILYIVGGAALGFAYYYFIGCASGACPITSNPYMSILWGALFGATLGYK